MNRDRNNSFSRFRYRLKKFCGLSRPQKWMLIEATLLLTVACLAVKLLPFRRIAPWLGKAEAASSRHYNLTDAERQQVCAVGRAVKTMAGNLPWSCVCLPQAIAAVRMLRARKLPGTLLLGVLREDGLKAHAWVCTGDAVVTGGGVDLSVYTVVSRFDGL